MWRSLLLTFLITAALAQDLPRGQIVESVKCADASQSYTLYLPSHYSADRRWSLILLFDPGGRGRRGVERYQVAAEKYGYIVAGSNNSRNGPWEVSMKAAQAMTADVTKRFSVDPKRMYTAGLSGGARVAMKVALESGTIAGVMASSAGFPDEPRKRLSFAVFGTAGTEDFNNLEMRQLDREVVSPHRVVVFEGGHTWLSSELATQAVEWMELQAMKSGRRPREVGLMQQFLAAREAEAAAAKSDVEALESLHALVTDFKGLADVSKFAARAQALERDKKVLAAIEQQRQEEQREARTNSEISGLEAALDGDSEVRAATLFELNKRLTGLASQAKAPQDSAERRLARRILSGVQAGSRGIPDPEYQELLSRVKPPGPADGGRP